MVLTGFLFGVRIIYGPFLEVFIDSILGFLAIMITGLFLIICRMRDKLDDLHATMSLEFGLQRAGYSLVDFFYDEASASPSLELIHLKILRFCRPAVILEIGSGQTTKILSSYAHENPSAEVLTLEQNQAFWELLRPHISHCYVHAKVQAVDFVCQGSGQRVVTEWYDASALLIGKKFEYILVDGPDYSNGNVELARFYRGGILKYLPEILADRFIIVFDDAQRAGDRMTIHAVQEILSAARIKYAAFERYGTKTQAVICSPHWKFIRTA